MKRFLTTGLVLLAMTGATASFGQSKRTYDDDIYYNSKPAKQEKTVYEDQPAQQSARDENQTYTSSGKSNESSNQRRYDNEEEYVNYDDEYYYSTHINQFYHPFYNRPYWSGFYNPNWYDPYWVDPYWGWSPWLQPGYSISVGWGGPYWSSYWGWQTWNGYIGFNSYFGYWGFGGGYYSGYWNGYYAGLYGHYGPSCYYPITYGPRYSMNGTRNSYAHSAHNVGYHGLQRETANSSQSGQLSESGLSRTNSFRTVSGSADRQVTDHAVRNNVGTEAPIRSNSADINRGEIGSTNNNSVPNSVSPRNDRWNGGDEVRTQSGSAGASQPRRERSSLFGGRSDNTAPNSVSSRDYNWKGGDEVRTQSGSAETSQPRRERGSLFGGRSEAPARSNSFDRSYSQPRMEQRSSVSPRMEAPSRSFGNSSGGRSFGNSSGGRSFGGGGGSFGGGSNGGGMRSGRR